jgi:hypothetical protein
MRNVTGRCDRVSISLSKIIVSADCFNLISKNYIFFDIGREYIFQIVANRINLVSTLSRQREQVCLLNIYRLKNYLDLQNRILAMFIMNST